MLSINTVFNAIDKLGREYKYLYIRQGIYNQNEFRLYNITLGEYTEVEEEWFNQREIEILDKVFSIR